MPTLKLRARGLRNADDERRVVAALRARQGVFGAAACATAGSIEVDFEDDEVSFDVLIDTVKQAGYDAELAG
jgi:hypothetical protein